MKTPEPDPLTEKITEGVKLAIKRLIEQTKKEDGELVFWKDGKVVKVKARDLKD
jgi:urease accessory protein UreE